MENLEDSSEKGKKPEKEYLATIKIKESIRLIILPTIYYKTEHAAVNCSGRSINLAILKNSWEKKKPNPNINWVNNSLK